MMIVSMLKHRNQNLQRYNLNHVIWGPLGPCNLWSFGLFPYVSLLFWRSPLHILESSRKVKLKFGIPALKKINNDPSGGDEPASSEGKPPKIFKFDKGNALNTAMTLS